MPQRFRQSHDAGMQRLHRTQQPRLIGRGPTEVMARRSDGSEFPLELTLNTMHMNGGEFFVGIMHDITQRREVERLKSEFASVVSHDCGPGIPEEFKSRIFQKFSQADGSDHRQKGGTGLGLAISRAIVEAMGGSIGFDSLAEGGAVFFVEMPCVRTADPEPAAVELTGTV